MLNERQHASLAKRLIDACGGLIEAAEHCRVSKSVLSDYQLPHKASTMPADVILCLQEYCGEPIYTSALTRASDPVLASADVETDSLSALEHMAHFAKEYRKAKFDGVISAQEERALAPTLATLRKILDGIDAGVTTGPVALRAAE